MVSFGRRTRPCPAFAPFVRRSLPPASRVMGNTDPPGLLWYSGDQEDSIATERCIVYVGTAKGNRRMRYVFTILGLLLLAGLTGLGQDGLQDADVQVTRQISTYHALTEGRFVVTLRLEAFSDLVGVGIAEVLPRDWTIDPVQNDGAAFKRADNEWVFAERIRAGGTRELIYEVRIPSSEQLATEELPGCFSIHGIVQARTPGVEVPIVGDSDLEVGTVLPIPSAVAHLMPQTEDAPDIIDLRMSRRISEDQLIRALEFWQAGIPVPGTGGRMIDLEMMELLVAYYETCTNADQPLPLAGEARLTSVRTINTFLPCDSVLLPEGCRDPGPNARRVTVAVTITAEHDAYGVGLAEQVPEGWHVMPVHHEELWYRGSTAEWIYPKRLAAGETIQVLYEIEVVASDGNILEQWAGCCGWDGTISGVVSGALGCGEWPVSGEELVHVWECLPVILAISRWDTELDDLDVTLSDFVSFSQVQRAVAFWLEGGAVPYTCGFTVGYETMKAITGHWLTHTPVTRGLPDAPPGPCDDPDLGCYIPAGSCEWFCEMRLQQPQADFVIVPVIAPPVVDAGPELALTCSNQVVTLEGSASEGVPPYRYQWIDGHGALIARTSSVEVSAPGMYVLIVTGSNGCSGSDAVVVTQDIETPVVDAGPDQILTCASRQVTLEGSAAEGTPPYAIEWVGPTGELVATALCIEVSVPGMYTLTVTSTRNGCSGSDTVIVKQDMDAPAVNATSDGVLTCANQQVTLSAEVIGGIEPFSYAWVDSSGTLIATTFSVDVSAPGTYTLSVTGGNGCTGSDTVVVAQDTEAPTVRATSDGALTCATLQVALRAEVTGGTEPFSYAWVNASGESIGTTASVNVSAAGSYTVTVTSTRSGCSTSDAVEVTEDVAAPGVVLGPDRVLTCASRQVTITPAVSGGTPPLAYTWKDAAGATVSQQREITVSVPGTYTLTVTGVNGCSGSDTIVVTQDMGAPAVSATCGGVLTCVNQHVSLTAGVTGGSAPFTYAWANPGGESIGTTASVNVSAPGTYTLTVTGSNGCSRSDTVTVTQEIDVPVVSATSDGMLTCANQQVTLTSDVTGGAGPFSYAWMGAGGASIGTTASVDVSAPGTYTVTVTSTRSGCSASDTVVVTQDIEAPVVNATSDGMLTCANQQVNLTADVTGGSAPFCYTWLDPSGEPVGTAASVDVSAPGTYTVTVTSTQSGCSASDTVVVTQDIEAPVVDATSDGVLTCADQQVNLTADVTGGSAPFCYTWLDPSGELIGTAASVDVSAPGTYTVTVTSTQSGCSASDTVVVTQDIEAPAVNATSDGVLTCANQQVTLGVEVIGGAKPFYYVWVDSGARLIGTTASVDVSEPGTYMVTVTGSNGCSASDTVAVTQDIEAPVVQATSDGVLTCANPEVTLSAETTGGSPPFCYTWLDSRGDLVAATAVVNVSDAGPYTLTVTGSNGCSVSDTVNVAKNIEPPLVSATSDGVLTCANPEVTLSAEVTGGSAPFSTMWLNSKGDLVATTATVGVSDAGTYTLIVTGSNGCSASDTATVTENVESPLVSVTSDGVLTCVNHEITLSAEVTGGSAPFNYMWLDAGGGLIATTPAVSVSDAMTYTLIVTGSNGCAVSETLVVTKDTSPPLVEVGEDRELTCDNNEVFIDIIVSGGTSPYSYLWLDDCGQEIAITEDITVTLPGLYTVTVTGANGCQAIGYVEVINGIFPPIVDAGPDRVLDCETGEALLDATVSGGTAPYEYVWSNACGDVVGRTEDLVVKQPSVYTLLVRTADGCVASDSVVVTQDPQ